MNHDRRAGRGLALILLLALASCGLAESVVEEFVDDQDYELYADGSAIGTLVREVDGTDVAVEQGVLRPGDRAAGHQALAVVGFGIDSSLQPDNTRLEGIRLLFWIEPGTGDVAPLGPLIVSHLPTGPGGLLDTGTIPHPPGADLRTVENTASPGWRDVDVSSAFLEDWNAGRSASAFAIRFATPVDGERDDDDIDLDPEVGGEVKRAHLILHFGVDL